MNNIYLLTILILPVLGSLMGYIIGRKNENLRNIFIDIITGIEFLLVIIIYPLVSKHPIEVFIPDIMGTGLYLKLDILRYILVFITAFIWFLTTIYSTQYLIKYKKRNRYYAFFMLTLSSTIGIFISENILNLFTFFEIMAFTSYVLVIHDEDEYSHDAGKIYLEMSIASGLITLMGILLLYDYTSTLNIGEMSLRMNNIGNVKYAIGFSLMIGFAVKASMFPLHVWLPKVYPAAPTPATAVLSGILAKSGVYGIMIVSVFIMNNDTLFSIILLIFSFLSMFIGGFLAMFQRNIKRILAYSSMSQIGYMLMGIALIGFLKEHSEIAIYGSIYHIVNHALFKVLLFMGAGIIYMILDELSINKIQGFGKYKNILKIAFLIGIFGVIGMPGFNGFISKTLLHHALSEVHHKYHTIWLSIAEIIFTICSSFTVAYLLKLFIAVFVKESDNFKGQYKSHIKKRALFPMIILSLSILFVAINPNFLINIMNDTLHTFKLESHGSFRFEFYSIENIKSSMITILIGCSIYVLFIRRHLIKKENDKNVYINPALDWVSLEDDIYKPLCIFIYKVSSIGFSVIDRAVVNSVKYIASSITEFAGFEIKNKVNGDDKVYKLSDISKNIGVNMNSITYSVFIIGVILVITTLILIML
ncbi:complex I subunit 5 family protein [Tepidibacter formicigenes]|jgi:hydrogenase-4 component B|uniref:Formate hydrogenlyase subunit 3/Multisubunit Na+/H+ antiporter, MnhD subunit n=1 Tax=Tepidibacter formicigenes DSM 15518 TaxID=1123349 RepID=A0A1M6NX87_9FIRM|nr:proton-conducting transporter membrane subunit [Tepidibacter formicigenes]SHK00303.1 Formate hydrogenlyase subunit 3/Multisubunit Na+/H+ antiporter, MnhD subunit [Tepidibacter formicigenes DSM 15518]